MQNGRTNERNAGGREIFPPLSRSVNTNHCQSNRGLNRLRDPNSKFPPNLAPFLSIWAFPGVAFMAYVAAAHIKDVRHAAGAKIGHVTSDSGRYRGGRSLSLAPWEIEKNKMSSGEDGYMCVCTRVGSTLIPRDCEFWFKFD